MNGNQNKNSLKEGNGVHAGKRNKVKAHLTKLTELV